MRPFLLRLICRALVACIACLPLQARAELVDTGQWVASQAPREILLRFAGRTEVARQMQAMGISPASAQERLAALTDAEAASLAERIGSLPAGAEAGSGLVLLMVIAFLVYLFWREVIMEGVR